METTIDDLLEKHQFTEEEIYNNIKDLNIPMKLESRYQLISSEDLSSLIEEVYSKWKSLSQKEEEEYNKKIQSVIEQLNVIEKYLIPDYFTNCSSGKELYHQWCLKQAKKKNEDLSDASILSELNFTSMEEKEKEKWNQLNEQHKNKLKEIKSEMKKINCHFLVIALREELNDNTISTVNFTKLIQNLKIENPETHERIMNNYIKLKNEHKMKCLYYIAASKLFYYYCYQRKIYYLDHNPKECFGLKFKEEEGRQKIERFIKDNKEDFEKEQKKQKLISSYCRFHRLYYPQILYHTVITPKLLFYKEHLSDKDILSVKENKEKVELLRSKWNSFQEKEVYINLHKKEKKKSIEEWEEKIKKEGPRRRKGKKKKETKIEESTNEDKFSESSDEETISNSVSDDDSLTTKKCNPEDKRRAHP